MGLGENEASTILCNLQIAISNIIHISEEDTLARMKGYKALILTAEKINSCLPNLKWPMPLPARAILALPLDKAYKDHNQQYMGHTYQHIHQNIHSGPNREISYGHSTPDGNCFFNSVSLLLFGHEEAALPLRARTALLEITDKPAECGEARRALVTPAALQRLLKLCQEGEWMEASYGLHISMLFNISVLINHPLAPNRLENNEMYRCYMPQTPSHWDQNKGTIILSWCRYNDQTPNRNFGRTTTSNHDNFQRCNHFIPMHIMNPELTTTIKDVIEFQTYWPEPLAQQKGEVHLGANIYMEEPQPDPWNFHRNSTGMEVGYIDTTPSMEEKKTAHRSKPSTAPRKRPMQEERRREQHKPDLPPKEHPTAPIDNKRHKTCITASPKDWNTGETEDKNTKGNQEKMTKENIRQEANVAKAANTNITHETQTREEEVQHTASTKWEYPTPLPESQILDMRL